MFDFQVSHNNRSVIISHGLHLGWLYLAPVDLILWTFPSIVFPHNFFSSSCTTRRKKDSSMLWLENIFLHFFGLMMVLRGLIADGDGATFGQVVLDGIQTD